VSAERSLTELLSTLPLVDGHCHPLPVGPQPHEVPAFSALLTEAGPPVSRPGTSPSPHPGWNSMAGVAVRRWCGPALGLGADESPSEYLDARVRLGDEEVTRRLLRAAGLSWLLVDTGLAEPAPASPETLAEVAGASWAEVVRLETVAERVATQVHLTESNARYLSAMATRGDHTLDLSGQLSPLG